MVPSRLDAPAPRPSAPARRAARGRTRSAAGRSGHRSARRTTSAPRSSAASRHDVTSASWSSWVQTIRSPGLPVVAARARVKARVIVVMFGPNQIARPVAPRSSPTVARAVAWHLVAGRRRGEVAAAAPVVATGRERRHRLDGGVHHLGAGRPVEAGPAVAPDTGEPLHQRRAGRARAHGARSLARVGARPWRSPAAQSDPYADDGVVVLRGLLDRGWLELLEAGVERNLAEPGE